METTFFPPRRNGLILHTSLLVLLITSSIWLFNQASRTSIGPVFALYLLALFACATAIPFLVYRLYGLIRSSYTLEAGRLRLTWGLRVEEIPLVNVNWILPPDALDYRVPLPLVRWPGSITGVRRLDQRTTIEFMASEGERLLMIETPRGIYAISPEKPDEFLAAFQRASEIGYFDPIQGESVRPGALVETVWENQAARTLVFSSVLAAILYAGWVLFIVDPQPRDRFPLGNTGRDVNGTLLFLLPVLDSLYFFANLLAGLFFFRREETKTLSYLLWLGSLVATVLFLIGTLLLVL